MVKCVPSVTVHVYAWELPGVAGNAWNGETSRSIVIDSSCIWGKFIFLATGRPRYCMEMLLECLRNPGYRLGIVTGLQLVCGRWSTSVEEFMGLCTNSFGDLWSAASPYESVDGMNPRTSVIEWRIGRSSGYSPWRSADLPWVDEWWRIEGAAMGCRGAKRQIDQVALHEVENESIVEIRMGGGAVEQNAGGYEINGDSAWPLALVWIGVRNSTVEF
eukprot:Gb_41523 [translate_table: standard]